MRLSTLQEGHFQHSITKLLKRKIVYYQGRMNGVTQMIDHLRYRSEKGVLLDGLDRRSEIQLEVLHDLRNMPRTDRLTTTGLQRLILQWHDENYYHANLLQVERAFGDLMLRLFGECKIPVLAFDNIEKIPAKAYPVLKELNEYTKSGKRCGVAIALGGEYTASKMHWSFLEKCTEVTVERPAKPADIKEVIEFVFPEHIRLFTKATFNELLRCDTLQQMVKSAELMIDNWQENHIDDAEKISDTLATSMVSKSKRLYKAAA